jgi:hypothetical protein
MYHQFNIQQFYILPKQCIYVFCGDLRIKSNTPIRDWFLQPRFTHLKHSGYYTYHQINIQQFYVLPTQCIYVFCVDLTTNSDYFKIEHKLNGFITDIYPSKAQWLLYIPLI